MELIQDIEISQDDRTEIVRAEKISDKIYRCLESTVFIDMEIYGCEIQVTENNGKFKFIKVHKESLYKTHRYLWSKEFLESEKGKKSKQNIIEMGGDWEQIMGGLFIIHLPKEKNQMLDYLLEAK